LNNITKPPPVINYKGKGYDKVIEALGGDPEDIEVNGKKIFAEKNLDNLQKHRVHNILKDKKPEDVKVALEVSEKMGLNNPHDVLEIVEIVSADVKGMSKFVIILFLFLFFSFSFIFIILFSISIFYLIN